jgi:CheY-like chemotaxis protein
LNPQFSTPQRVLLVDESPDARQVLRTVLERRGLEIYEADGAGSGSNLIRQHQPHLVVMDVESQSPEDCDACRAATREAHSSLVVLGVFPRHQLGDGEESRVSKPYHFAPLVRTIERLLDDLGDSSPSPQ